MGAVGLKLKIWNTMAQDSNIEWTRHTGNLWWGCTKVHAGCDHCYAETMAKRWDRDIWGKEKPRLMVKSFFTDLAKYQKLAAQSNEMHRVFVGSMMDIFEKPMPLIDHNGNKLGFNTGALRDDFFRLIGLGAYPNLMPLLLTKRPSNINTYTPEYWKETPPENVIFGTSPVNQETYKNLKKHLLEVNGKRFLSIEPQLADIDLGDLSGIHWVIQGGESGHHARPFNLDWAYKMQAQCKEQGVPYFFKQIDKKQPIPSDLLNSREFPKCNLHKLKRQ